MKVRLTENDIRTAIQEVVGGFLNEHRLTEGEFGDYEDQFDNSVLENKIRKIVKSVVNETRFGEPKYIEGDIVNGKTGYLIDNNGNGQIVTVLDNLEFTGNSIIGYDRMTGNEETLYLTGMFARPLDGFTLPSAQYTKNGLAVKHLQIDGGNDYYQLLVND